MSILRLSVFVMILANMACNQDEDRFERIAKLRGVGLVSNPVIAAPSTDTAPSQVKFTFYAAAPLGETVIATPYEDAQGSLRKVSVQNLQIGEVSYEDHASLRIIKVTAIGIVPPERVIYFDPYTGFSTARYAISLVGQTGTQIIAGNLVVYPTGAAELTTKNNLPKIAIQTPSKDGSIDGTSQDIKAEITEVNDETFRVGWFVSGGKLDARNKLTAKWQPTGSGKYTVIVTARGTKTSAFSLDVVDVTAN